MKDSGIMTFPILSFFDTIINLGDKFSLSIAKDWNNLQLDPL